MGFLGSLKLYMWLVLRICWLLSRGQQMLKVLNPSGIRINFQLLYCYSPLLPSCSVGFLRFSLTSWPLILYYLFKMAAYFHFHQTQRTNSTYSALPDWLLLSLLPTFLPPSYTLACFLFLEICQGNSHIRGLNPHSIPTTLFLITCILVE